MDPKYARSAVDRLLADLEKDPRIGRPSLMRRYGRPLGFGLALGLGGITGCSSDSDAVPPAADAYGVADTIMMRDASDAADAIKDVADALPVSPDAYGIVRADVPPSADVADALPLSPDAYGMVGPPDVPPRTDVADALPAPIDVYGGDSFVRRDVLPPPGDAYGITRDALPPPVDVYAADRPLGSDAGDALPPEAGIDGGALDADKTG